MKNKIITLIVLIFLSLIIVGCTNKSEPVKEEKKEDNVVSFSDDVFPEKKEMHTVKMPDMVSENTVSEKPQGLDKIDFEKQLEESLKDL